MSDQAPSGVPRWLAGAAAISWRVLVVVAAIVLLGLAFARLEVVVVPVVAALFFTTVLWPPAEWLRRHRVPGLLATWLVLLAAAAVVTGIVFGVLPGLEKEVPKLGTALAQGVTKIQHWLVDGPLHLSSAQVNGAASQVVKFLTSHQSSLIQGALTGFSVAASVLAGALLTIVLTFFFVKDGRRIASWFVGLASERRARDLSAVGSRAWTVLTGYIRGTACNGAVNALVLSMTMVVMGIPFAPLVGLVTFVGGFLPLVGGILSGAVAVLVALVSNGPVAAGVMVAATILVHNLEGYLIGPLVLGKAVRLHPVAVLLVLGVGTIIGGAIGAFLAVPVAGVVLSVAGYYRSGGDELILGEAPAGRRRRRPGPGARRGADAGSPGAVAPVASLDEPGVAAGVER